MAGLLFFIFKCLTTVGRISLAGRIRTDLLGELGRRNRLRVDLHRVFFWK